MSCLPANPGVFCGETRRAKEVLEDIIQQPVKGYRAASYSITPKSTWALDVIAELGFPLRFEHLPGRA